MDRSTVIDLLKKRGASSVEISRLLSSFGHSSISVETRESDWRDGLEYIHDAASKTMLKAAEAVTAELVEIDEEGFVIGKCKEKRKTYSTAFRCDTEFYNVSFSCTCITQKNQRCCAHGVAFVRYLESEMRNLDSPIRDQIITKLELTPDPSLTGTLALSMLDQFIEYSEQQTDEGKQADQELTRIVWRVTLESEFDLDIEPVLQKQKKRGNGWTKGRSLRVDTMRDNENFPLTPIDLDVLHARNRTYGYYGGYQWDFIAALTALKGHEHVEFNGAPTAIHSIPFQLVIEEQNGGYHINLDSQGSVIICDGGYVVCDVVTNFIYVCKCEKVESELAEMLQSSDLIVPASRLDDLKKRLDRLSKGVTIRQPLELAGPIQPAESQPVLKLLSRKDGQLQCGIRVRTNGTLNRPGEGVLILHEKQKENNVQLQRDPAAEQLTCRALISQLGLNAAHPVADWDWRFAEFEDSLAFLSILEAKSAELGVEALWDEESMQALSVVGSISAKNVQVELTRKKDWFGIEGGFTLGDHEFSLPELLAAVDSEPAKGYTELRPGMWAKITERLRNRLRELRDISHKNRSELEIDVTGIPIIQSLLEAELDIKASAEWDECVKRLECSKKLRPNPSKKLKAELRDYQRDGYRWMRRLAEWGVGGCLADDMGLGKTVQALTVLLDRAKKGPTLVIAPTSVGFNWQRETEKFTPSLNAHLYRETERADFLETVKNGDVVICSYGLALRDVEAISGVEWGTLVLDEAQFIKNARSKTAQAIRMIPADWKLALTGTPMENHLGELWSIFRTISPGLFGSWEQFRTRFAAPIEKDNDPERRKALSRLIQPFVLRRTKSAVLKDLPERTEINLRVELSDAERQRYDEMRMAAIGELDEIVGLPDTNDQRFRVLAILTRLRQMACHIGLVDDKWEGESAKLDLLVDKVKELKDEGHRVLIFSQFTKYLALIRKVLEENQVSFEYLDGKTTPKARQQRVDKFQEGETDAFLISLKAGGTGLNLTAADYVIHMDPWWNPAVEDQATDRSHRIGQTRPVIVYRIVASGTVEDQILSLHADKRDLVAGIMEGTQKAAKMSTDQLLEMIRQK